jgi:non-ribosomal peptide synthetase component F
MRELIKLAHYLQKKGVGPEKLVGICIERSLEMMVGILGIMKAGGALDVTTPPAKGLVQCTISALKSAITHNNFTMCTTARSRFASHFSVFFGFIALFVVALWVITADYNPIIQKGFVYPFSFWNFLPPSSSGWKPRS